MADNFELQAWPADEFMKLEFPPEPDDPEFTGRQIRLTPASMIEIEELTWLWDERIPCGEITLVPGRPGIGKSLFLSWLSAQVTRGTLPGALFGKPRTVIYAATEDSWSRTIAPRLHAAGADMHKVFRVDVEAPDGTLGNLTVPVDCRALEREIDRLDVALLAADPLLSLIGAGVDTHKDQSTRTALEPLARVAHDTDCSVVGLAHFNKSGASDPLELLGGSRAFSAVIRALLPVVRDTEADDGSCVMSQGKSNVGRLDLPSLRYRIEAADVPSTTGTTTTGRLVFTGESERSVEDILSAAAQPAEDRSERNEAADWLRGYIEGNSGEVAARDAIKAARAEGIAERTLRRARAKAGVVATQEGFPARSVWRIPPANG